jgi:hypothetical protein
MARRLVRLLGSPRTLIACVLVVVLSWATVGMTGVEAEELDLCGARIRLPRLEAWSTSRPPDQLRLIRIDTGSDGTLAVVGVQDLEVQHDVDSVAGLWLADAEHAYLALSRYPGRAHAWAPTTDGYLLYADFNMRAASLVRVQGRRDALAAVMDAVPAENRGQWTALWENGRPKLSLSIRRVLWWGYVWNGVTLAALIGVVAWPFVAAFSGWRTDRRRARGQCVRCAYQLKTDAMTLETCPECGARA